MIVHETLGRRCPDGAAAASLLWLQAHGVAQMMPDSVRRAGFEGEGLELGEALFEAILSRESGLVFTVDDYDETLERARQPRPARHAVGPRAARRAGAARATSPRRADPDFPFVLSAGERRSHTANTIFRDPAWRKTGRGRRAARASRRRASGSASPTAGAPGSTTKRGSVETIVEVTDTLQPGLRHAAERPRHSPTRRATGRASSTASRRTS